MPRKSTWLGDMRGSVINDVTKFLVPLIGSIINVGLLVKICVSFTAEVSSPMQSKLG